MGGVRAAEEPFSAGDDLAEVQREDALALALALSDEWRASLPNRLPGLAIMEERAADWAARLGQQDVARRLMNRAAGLSGRNAPWPPDEPEIWNRPRSVEGLLRFGMAATTIELPVDERG
jgi:hypothetical protein